VTRFALAVCFLASWSAACLQSHDSGTMAVGDSNCVVCHQADYDHTSTPASAALKVPDHKALGYATTCADCHVTAANPLPWKLATDHNSQVFAIDTASPHKNIACTSCHNVDLVDPANPQVPVGSSLKGENTDCISCHLNDATQQGAHTNAVAPLTFPSGSRYAGALYEYKSADHRFCLDCHPNGTGGKHNETIFPSNHKASHSPTGMWKCSDCHQPALGSDSKGMNAPCVNSQCHSSVTSGNHGDGPRVTDKGPTSCLGCHPHGQGGG